jgi:hypothetical protein
MSRDLMKDAKATLILNWREMLTIVGGMVAASLIVCAGGLSGH